MTLPTSGPVAVCRTPWMYCATCLLPCGPAGALVGCTATAAAARLEHDCVNALDCAWLFFAGLLLTAAARPSTTCSPTTLRPGRRPRRHGRGLCRPDGVGGCEPGERARRLAGCSVDGPALSPVAIESVVTGNVLPWAVVQFGGMALVLVVAGSAQGPGPARWTSSLGWVIFCYAAAKLLEMSDHAIFDAHQPARFRPYAQAPGGGARGPAGAAASVWGGPAQMPGRIRRGIAWRSRLNTNTVIAAAAPHADAQPHPNQFALLGSAASRPSSGPSSPAPPTTTCSSSRSR